MFVSAIDSSIKINTYDTEAGIAVNLSFDLLITSRTGKEDFRR